MSDPLVPNYKKNVGRLATDRFDFQNHIEGGNFRHTATQIDLDPPLVFGGAHTQVQQMLEALMLAAEPPVIQDASTTVKGIVKLSGDIGGAATNVVVQRIQGLPISTLTPNNGDVLTWDGYSNIWNPSVAINAFSAAGDLGGNNILQNVIGLTGTSGVVRASCDAINFVLGITPSISQDDTSITNGNTFTIKAQTATGSNKSGGSLVLSGGNKGTGTGLRGGVSLKLTSADGTMLGVSEVAVGRRVLSLVHDGTLTTTDMPANTGDMVIYIRDAATVPSTGSPVNGSILYSTGGSLWVKQQDGNNFSIGSIPNPSIWGSSGQETYTQRSFVTSTTVTPQLAFSFSLPDNTATRADVIFIGKKQGSADSAQFNLSVGYVRSGGAPIIVGTLTNFDQRNTAGASGWVIPNIIVSGNTLQVFTGGNAATNINWFIVTRLSMSQG